MEDCSSAGSVVFDSGFGLIKKFVGGHFWDVHQLIWTEKVMLMNCMILAFTVQWVWKRMKLWILAKISSFVLNSHVSKDALQLFE